MNDTVGRAVAEELLGMSGPMEFRRYRILDDGGLQPTDEDVTDDVAARVIETVHGGSMPWHRTYGVLYVQPEDPEECFQPARARAR